MRCWCGDSALALCCLFVCSDTVGRDDLDQTRDRRQQVVFPPFYTLSGCWYQSDVPEGQLSRRLLLLMDKVSQPCNLCLLFFLTFTCNFTNPHQHLKLVKMSGAVGWRRMDEQSLAVHWVSIDQPRNHLSVATLSERTAEGQMKCVRCFSL